jgi:hypothetical protein
MTLGEYLSEIPFPGDIYVYHSDNGPIKIGRLAQYRESLRAAAIAYNMEAPEELLWKEREDVIEEMTREKYKEIYGLSWDIIGKTTAQEMIDTESQAENDETNETQEENGWIFIENNGQGGMTTNFWQTDFAKNGYCFVTLDAGYYRLLVPYYRKDWLAEMKTAREVIISRGPWPSGRPPKKDAFEIMFEDGTSSPFIINVGPEQWDRAPGEADQGWKGVFSVYFDGATKPTLEFKKVFYRRVPKIPWLKKVE